MGLEDTPFNVIHNGFEFPQEAPPEAARAELRRELSIPHNVHIIGSILRFSEEKQPKKLIDAAIAVARKHSSAHFAFFGNGAIENAQGHHRSVTANS